MLRMVTTEVYLPEWGLPVVARKVRDPSALAAAQRRRWLEGVLGEQIRAWRIGRG